MPPQGSTVKLKNWQKTFKCLRVVYADPEALEVRTEEFEVAEELLETRLNKGEESSCVTENQYPCSFGAVLVDSRNTSVKMEQFYRGEDCIAVHMRTLRKWLRWEDTERQRYRFLKMYTVGKRELCQKISESDHEKVVHHSHLTGTVFGVAHSSCNL